MSHHIPNVYLASNGITEAPDSLSALTNLASLSLKSNHLKVMPTVILTLKRLEFLDLSENCLEYAYAHHLGSQGVLTHAL